MSDPEPGWDADPAGSAGTYRWWDGQTWTRWLSRDPAAPAPPTAPPAPQLPAPGPEPTADQQPTPDAEHQPPDATAPVLDPELPAEPLVRMPVAVAVVVAALLVGVVTVGVVVSASAQGLRSGPPLPPPPRRAEHAVSYDAADGIASVGTLRMTLPTAPYECPSAPATGLPTFTSVIGCNAAVHRDYDRKGNDWTASVMIGVIPDSLVVAGDLRATTNKVTASLRGQAFAGVPTRAAKLVTQPTNIGPAGTSFLVTGHLHYQVSGVASTYDRVLVLVVALADDEYGVVFASVPNDTPKAAITAVDTTLDSVKVT